MAIANDTVDTVNPEYNEMLTAWELCDDLMGGTRTMRAAGTKWLPKEDKEKNEIYQIRLSRSVLLGAYEKAVTELSGRPFSKPVQLLGDPLPEPLDMIAEGVDDEGRDLTAFWRHVMQIGLHRGLVHVLTDYVQDTEANPLATRTKAQEQAMKLRPMMLAIDPINLKGWRYEKSANGDKVLTQVRIWETTERDKGAYAVETVERIRVITPTQWQLWENVIGDTQTGWQKTQEGNWSAGRITLTTIYFNRTGFMTGAPCLEALAWLNLAHWQSLSDHRNNVRFARAGVLAMLGFTQEEIENNDIVWGVNHKIMSTNPAARVQICEHSGSSTQVGEAELTHLEEMMTAMGKQPLVVRGWGNVTAMSQAIEEGKGTCDLQMWVRLTEAGAKRAYQDAAYWVHTELPDNFAVDIYDDFGIAERSANDVDDLVAIWQAKGIDHETFLQEIKLRGTLSEKADIEEIMEKVKNEGPALGMMGREEVLPEKPVENAKELPGEEEE